MSMKNKILRLGSLTIKVFMSLLVVIILSTSVVGEVRATQAPSSVGVSTPEQVDHTYFLILELVEIPKEEETVRLTVTVYDNVTKEPIGEIVVELYYEQAKDPITGSDGWYLTDVDGNIVYELSEDTIGDWYHFEVNTPGYYPYYGDEFELTGDMHIDIYLDPVDDEIVPEPEPEPELEPEVKPEPKPEPEPEVKPEPEPEAKPEPESEPEPEVMPEKGDSDIPKTGDSTAISFYLSLSVIALVFILLLLFKKDDDDEDNENIN